MTSTVARQRDALAETLTNAPVAISNLQNAYNPRPNPRHPQQRPAARRPRAAALLAGDRPPTGTGNTDLCKSLGGLFAPLAQGLKGGGGGVKLPLNLLSAVPAGASSGAGERAAR